ncbi:alpha/beta hydrolase [Lentilactobacillus raoultii]|uniref:Alpha/beta hydrolase n=1 Tax=Lentilactobacillus raoultii TaxID=1987503 RepID=A0ABW3PDK6_9LACO|nr:alpha/beta hydrolase [Lentilactobacillus raoultii]
MKTITYTTTSGEKIQSSFWQATGNTINPTIIYIHGGGLIFGNRDDLPQTYLDRFLNAGYSVFALDYLLAPESTYQDIIDSVKAGVTHFLNHFNELGVQDNRYILFGRSAGAYLCMQLIADDLSPKPTALIDFYGFESLLASNLLKPNALYSSYPKVTKAELKGLVGDSPVSHSSYEERFLIYVYARQTADWQKMIFQGTDGEEIKLTKELLTSNFPPTYICQSNADPDVPFINSIMLKAKLPNAKLMPITSKDHDFDRVVSPETLKVYEQVIDWLDHLI